MDGPSFTERAYAPPQAPAQPEALADPGPGPARLAGVLLLIDSGLGFVLMGIQYFVGLLPDAITVAQQVLQAGIGVGLLRMGRRFIIPALVYVAIKAGLPLFQSANVIERVGAPMLLILLFFVGMSVLPMALLLIGRCGPGRRLAAIVLFVIAQALELLAGLSRISMHLDRS